MEKKKFKFNVVDAIIVVLIVAAVLVVGLKVSGGLTGGKSDGKNRYEISFLCEEVPDFAASVIKVGDKVTCEASDNNLGVVKEVKIEPSRTYVTTAEGDVICTGKDHYNCVSITAEVIADEYEHGLKVKGAKYGVGHSITIRVGKAKIFGRISGIEVLNKLDEKEVAAIEASEKAEV
ncbi:MAG: DUF4330 domain-containing protein [Clostridia bacterium]